MTGRKALAAAACAVAVLAASPAWAVDKTWTGASSTTWSTGSNWTPAGPPGVNDRAIINNVANDPVLTGSTSIAQLVVNAGGVLTINNGVTLTVANTTVSPLIDGTGTVGGAGLLQVTNAPNTGTAVLFNDSLTIAAFTLNGPTNALAFNIPSGRTVTCNGAFTLTRSTLNVGDAAGAASTLHINGACNVQTNGTLVMRAPASTLRVSGTFTLTGGWTAGTSTLFLDPTANQTLSIATGAPRQFWNVTIQTDTGGNQIDGDLVTPNASMTINNNLTITRGQFQVGNFTVIVGGNLSSGTTAQSQFDFTSTGTLRARGNVDIASLSQITTQVSGPFATIIMDGTTLQTFQMRAPSNTQYHDIDHFQVSNPAGVTILDNPGADFTVNGQLTIDANCTLTVRDVFDPESPLTMGANSTLRLENVIRQDSTIVGSTFTAGAGSTVVYAGQGINQTVYAQQNGGQQIQYQNLTIDNVNAVASHQNSNDLLVNGNFTILGAGSSFTGIGNRTLTVRQSFISNGTFTNGGGTVIMAGTGSISGTAPSLVFNNLFVNGAASDTVTAQRSFTTSATFQVSQGALTTSGAITLLANAGMLVGNGAGAAGTADLNLVGPSVLQINSGQTFSVNATDGRFTSVVGGGANPTLTRAGATSFTATVDGQANLFGLNFSFGNLSGLNFTATATIERLRNVRFTNINGAANSRHLTITSAGLDLDAPGCMFDTVGAGQFNVFAFDSNTGNGIPVRLRFELRTTSNAAGAIGGPGAGDNFDGDDDTNANGVIAAPETVSATFGGSIVQWPYTANTDMAGVIQGFPLPAFDWNTFTYYSTYVLMQNTAAFDTIYVLDANGDVRSYSFTLATAGVRIVGPIFWDSEGANHVVYFGTSNGEVHKLIDNGSSLVAAPAPWNTPFLVGGTTPEVTSPVISDRTNVFFAARSSGTHGIYAVSIGTKTQALTPACPTGAVRPATAPAWTISGGITYLFWGSTATGASPAGSRLYRVRTNNWGNIDAQFNSGSVVPPAPDFAPANSDCTADILALANATNSATNSTVYLYVGEMNGYMHALDAVGTFTTVRPGFPFRNSNSPIRGGAVMDWFTNRLFFGNAAGTVYTLGTYTTAWTPGSNLFQFATGGGAIQTMPLYEGGVLYVSNTNGNLYALDVSAQTLIRTWNLGITAATNDVGDVSRDVNTGRIYVGTSGGRLYSVASENDPTATP
jgi:hypothetical protein